MGRHIYATEVGSLPLQKAGSTWVHKFWFGSQSSSDIETYLETTERTTYEAEIHVNDEAGIKEVLAEQVKAFNDSFNLTYEQYMAKIKSNGYLSSSADEETQTPLWREMEQAAARVELGENLLDTIANMKAKGIESQTLDIEC